MNEDKLLHAVGELDDKLIEEAATKKKNKSKKWVKWMSVAASVCVIIIVGAIVINQNEGMDKDGEHVGQTEPGIYEPTTKHDILYEGYPEIGPEDTPDVEPKVYEYYIFDGEGKYKLIEESSNIVGNMTIEEMLKKFFVLNNVDSLTIKNIEGEYKDGYDEVQGDMVVHYVDTYIWSVYLEGETLTDDLAIGLVNSLLSFSEEKAAPSYVKLYLNDEPFFINGEMPEKGYTHIEVDIEGEEKKEWADDWEETVMLAFVVKDENGNPMKNITYSLEYISGERGSYHPGYGITDSTGEFERNAHPDAVYLLHLQKRNAVVYSAYEGDYEGVVYEEMTVRLDVTESFTKEIIWSTEDVVIVNERKNPVTIDISKVCDKEYGEVFVQLFTEYGTQIQLGYPDETGKIIWNDGKEGNYYLEFQLFDKTERNEKLIYSRRYWVEIKDGEMFIINECGREMDFLE